MNTSMKSKPIINRTFKCLKRGFGFQFHRSSSICEDLIRAYPRSKEIALINDWEMIAYWEESDWSETLSCNCGSFQKQLGSLGQWQQCNPRKTLQFSPLFKIGDSFPSTLAAKKLSCKYKHWLPLSITYTMPERQSSKSDKVRKQENFKNPNFPTL